MGLSGWTTAALTTTAVGVGFGGVAVQPSLAAEDSVALTDEEMAARVAKMKELRNGKKSNGQKEQGINPEAGANLRSRSALENAKLALQKQKELKNRDKME